MATHLSLLRPLGIVGYDPVEPALLAALATEEPLLLVSEHGAAKTLLLVRLAEALGLELRHYNASLLQFDDLLGFPIPDERGGVRYAAPPGAIWGAEAAFFDEIGRCRPESANKLFPLIHERRIQGIALDRLRHRWAATNPPAEALAEDRLDDPYEGVEPLDPALADRFSFVVPLPRFADLSDEDRLAIIGGAGERAAPDAGRRVRELVQTTRELIAARSDELHQGIVVYVHALTPRLAEAGVATGGRRAAILARNIVAVWAACMALGRSRGEEPFVSALLASIPDVVRRAIPRSVLLAAHRVAWREVSLPKADPRRVVESVRDPLRRALLALTLPKLKPAYRGELLVGALAELAGHEAEILAWHVLPRLLEAQLVPAHAVETVAKVMLPAADGGKSIRGFGTAAEWVQKVRAAIAETALPNADAEYLFNVIARAFAPPIQLSGTAAPDAWRTHLDHCLGVWQSCVAALGKLPDAEAPPAGHGLPEGRAA
jgi:MoxR-like ATPase